MKNILTLALVLWSITFWAQEPSLQEDAKALVKLTFDISEKQQRKYLMTRGVAEDKREAFKHELDNAINAYTEECAKYYIATYSHAEIKELLQFYATPVGIKIAKDGRKLLSGDFPKGKEWELQIYDLKEKKKQ